MNDFETIIGDLAVAVRDRLSSVWLRIEAPQTVTTGAAQGIDPLTGGRLQSARPVASGEAVVCRALTEGPRPGTVFGSMPSGAGLKTREQMYTVLAADVPRARTLIAERGSVREVRNAAGDEFDPPRPTMSIVNATPECGGTMVEIQTITERV